MQKCEASTDLSSESLFETELVSLKDEKSLWVDHFLNWEKSGLSQAEYCRRNDLKYCHFHYWKRKLSKPPHLSPLSAQTESQRINFVELGAALPLASGMPRGTVPGDIFRLWVGGICVEVGNKFNPQSLSRLLRCLRTL
jgi:hypothetical protein